MNKELEMNFSTSNSCLRSFHKIFCSWGQRKTPYDVNKQIKGQTSPLWANPRQKWFLSFFIVNLLSSLLFAAIFIANAFYLPDTNCNNSNSITLSFIVIGGIVLFGNSKFIIYYLALYWLFLYLKDYANDQEWSRYLIFCSIFNLALLGYIIASFLLIKTHFKSCTNWIKALNYVVSVVSLIISIMVFVITLLLAKDFFLYKHVPHTAICEDEDIIIME